MNENDKFGDLIDETEDMPFFKKLLLGTVSYVLAAGMCAILAVICIIAVQNGIPVSANMFILISFAVPAGVIAALYQMGKAGIRLMPAAFGLVTALLPLLILMGTWQSFTY